MIRVNVHNAARDALRAEGSFRISNLYTVIQAIVCLGLYLALACSGVYVGSLILWLALWPLLAFLMAGFLGASHDCAHQVHVSSPLANRVAGTFWAGITSVNFTLYKHFHLDHHRFVGTDQDTEPAGEFDSVLAYFKSLPTLHFFMTFWRMSWRSAFGNYPHFIRTERQRRAVRQDGIFLVLWFIATTVLSLVWPRVMIPAYWIPLVMFFPTIFIFSLPEHYGCEMSLDIARNTASVRSWKWVEYLYWHGNYHAEHHVFPRLPTRHLPRAHDLLRGTLLSSRSYVRFHLRVIRQLSKRGRALIASPALSATERIHYKELLESHPDRPQERPAGGS